MEFPPFCFPCSCGRYHDKTFHKTNQTLRLRHQYVNTQERRNVIASGMKRFDTRIDAKRSQPPVERLSDRVTCVLGGNPNAYTINGTNCYLIGKGSSRILVDCAEKYLGNSEFLRNLDVAMKITGATKICAVVITHLHHDHYGGIYSIQKIYGPGIPVYKSDVPDYWWDSLNGIRNRNLLHYFVRADGMFRVLTSQR